MNVGPVGCLNVTSAAIAACLGLAASMPALAQQAVQWRVEDGGNGHWYELRTVSKEWLVARQIALAAGGDLASLETTAEYAWCKGRFLSTVGDVQVGGVQASPAASPSSGWSWLTGVAFSYTIYADDNPCSCGSPQENGEQNYLHSAGFGNHFGDANSAVFPCNGGCGWTRPFLIEWSADCDDNGVVDYGEILDGTLADTNANGVPDCCDAGVSCDPCPGDLNQSGTVDAEDLAFVLFAWGTDGGKTPEADIDRSGTVDANDLSVVLGSWGPCPN